jgi:hypothetical protein
MGSTRGACIALRPLATSLRRIDCTAQALDCWNFCQAILATIFCITQKKRSSLSSWSAMVLWASCASMRTSVRTSLKSPIATALRCCCELERMRLVINLDELIIW